MSETPRLSEFERIETFLRPLAEDWAGAFGLTDDAAVLSVQPDEDLVVTADAIVAGVHFLNDDPPETVAAKLLRVNLSDLAAKGAEPLGYVMTLALPAQIDDAWLGRFAAGLGTEQSRWGLHLLGGDSVATLGPPVLSVTAFGRVPSGTMVRRRLSQGEAAAVLVSGTIGDGALGLEVLIGRRQVAEAVDRDFLIERYRRPQPRLDLVPVLRRHALAAIDVSDGLAADFAHLCRASGRAGVLEAARVPLSAPAAALCAEDPTVLPMILGGGDDYEVLFAVAEPAVPQAIAEAAERGVQVVRIGRIGPEPGAAVTVLDGAGRPLVLARTGWRHS